MTNRKTQVAGQFKKSVGAGFQSLLGKKGRTYFVLEFKTKTEKYSAGKSITFTSDYIELGRDEKAALKFSPNELFISRKHAAIQREGNQYVLKHLSQTNPTLLNKQPIAEQYILQNGDEIQLSLEGPKIGFMAPANNTAKSLPLSVRLDSFRREALLPYKTAFIISSVFFLLAISGLGYFLYQTQQDNQKQAEAILKANEKIAAKEGELTEIRVEGERQAAANKQEINRLTRQNVKVRAELLEILESNKAELAVLQKERQQAIKAQLEKEQAQQQSISKKELMSQEAIAEANALLKPFTNDVYKIYVDRVEFKAEGLTVEELEEYHDLYFKDYNWTGTGVLLDDGRFITARHVIQPWYYINSLSGPEVIQNVLLHNFPEAEITAYFVAMASNGKRISFNSNQFTKDDDQIFAEKNLEYGGKKGLKGKRAYLGYTNWVSVKVKDKGLVTTQSKASDLPLANRNIFLLGFPTQKENEKTNKVEPIFSVNKLSAEGIENQIISIINEVNSGYSGAPVFIIEEGEVQFVGIVSAKLGVSNNFAIPIVKL